MSALLSILVIATASAADTSAWVWDGGEREIQLPLSTTVVDAGETWLGSVSSDDDASVQGKLLWAPETGRLYAQGTSDKGGWALDAQCQAFGEGYLCASGWGRIGDPTWGRVTEAVHAADLSEEIWNHASGVALWELIGEATDGGLGPESGVTGEALAYWQPSKSGKEQQFVVAGQSFRVEIDGVDAGHFMGVDLAASSSICDEDLCLDTPLCGIYDSSAGTLSLSWYGDGSVALVEGSATLGDNGLVAEGSILLWNAHAGEGSVVALGINDDGYYSDLAAELEGTF
jgi:hypothetical protein